MTLNEFLFWEDGTDTRYELWTGTVIPSPVASPRHRRLAAAIGRELGFALRGHSCCHTYSRPGLTVPGANETCYLPDVVVSCTPLQADDRLIRDPVLIVEVLSPSTAASDRQVKVPDFRCIPSVREILLIDSESIFADVLRRDGERWITEIVRGAEAVLTLQSVPLSVGMAALYDGIPLEQPAPTGTGPS